MLATLNTTLIPRVTTETSAVFAGGPVRNESKKHEGLGESTPYNEYMALHVYWCGRRGRWWYQLIHEMDDVCRRRGIEPKFAEMIAVAIKLYGDNDAATAQAKEIRLTAKSRHVFLAQRIVNLYTRSVESLDANPHQILFLDIIFLCFDHSSIFRSLGHSGSIHICEFGGAIGDFIELKIVTIHRMPKYFFPFLEQK